MQCSLAPLHPNTLQNCDEVGVADGDGGALRVDVQLRCHEGGHCSGPANQLQVVDYNLDLDLRYALHCNGLPIKKNIPIYILII